MNHPNLSLDFPMMLLHTRWIGWSRASTIRTNLILKKLQTPFFSLNLSFSLPKSVISDKINTNKSIIFNHRALLSHRLWFLAPTVSYPFLALPYPLIITWHYVIRMSLNFNFFHHFLIFFSLDFVSDFLNLYLLSLYNFILNVFDFLMLTGFNRYLLQVGHLFQLSFEL